MKLILAISILFLSGCNSVLDATPLYHCENGQLYERAGLVGSVYEPTNRKCIEVK